MQIPTYLTPMLVMAATVLQFPARDYSAKLARLKESVPGADVEQILHGSVACDSTAMDLAALFFSE